MPIRGETIGTAYVRVLADGSGLDKDLERQMESAGQKAGKKFEQSFDDAWTKELKKSLDDLAKQQETLRRSINGTKGAITRQGKEAVSRMDDWSASIKRAQRAFDNAEDAFTRPLTLFQQQTIYARQSLREFVISAKGSFNKARAEARDSFTGMRVAVKQFADDTVVGFRVSTRQTREFFDAVDRRSKIFKTTLDDFTDSMDEFGDSVGRAFGKGSRNNFINFMGAFIGRMASLPGLLASAGSGFIGFGNKIKTAFDDAGGGIRGMFGGLSVLVRAVGGAGIAIVGLTAIVGTFTSAIILASGVVIALASSLSFALVGAIGLLAGAMVPLVAGIGVAVLGFANMDKAAKDSFKGVTDAFKGLGDTAADTMFKDIGDSAEALEGVIEGLNPLVEALAGAVRDVFDGWIEGVQSKEFQGFINNLSTTLPDMIRSLGEIAGNIGQGLANIWIVASPHVQEFLGWLAGVTQGFADLNTVQGGKLDTFFDNAAESLKAVAGFLESVISLTAEFFSAGKDTGDQIFRDIGDAIEGWVTHLRENPDILENFFRDAKKFAGALGNVVQGAGELIDTLDSPATREFAISLTKGIGDGLKLLADLLGPVVKLLNEMDSSARNVAIGLGIFAAAFPGVSGKVLGLATNLGSVGRKLDENSGKFTRFKANMQGAAGVGGLALLTTGLVDAAEKGNTFGNTLTNVAGGAGIGAMFGPMGALIGAGAGLGLSAVAAGFADTADEARKARLEMQKDAGFKDAADDADRLAESLNGVVKAYGKVTREAVESSFSGEDGKLESDISLLRKWGFSMDTITSATLGQGDALTKVQTTFDNTLSVQQSTLASAKAAWEDAKDGAILYTDELGRMQTIHLTTDEIDAYGESYEKAQKNVDDTTLAQERFEKRVEETGGALDTHSEKIQKLVADLDITRKQYNQFPTEVRTRFEADGLPQSARDAIRLIGEYKELQNFRSIKALVSAPGVDTTRRQIKNLAEQYKLTPKQVRTLLRLEGITKTRKDLDGVNKELDRTGRRKIEPKIKPQVKEAEIDIESMKRKLTDVGRKESKPKVKADKSDFDNKMSDVKTKVDNTDKLSPKVKVTADTAAASQDLTGIQNQVNNLPPSKTINIHTNYTSSGKPPKARGGVIGSAQELLVGEQGPEAIVPLNRPLSMVDPAVRELSAIAQGLATATPTATRATVDMGGVTIITPTRDPAAVAQEVMNRLVAVGY